MGLREGQIWPKSIVDVTTLAPTSQIFLIKNYYYYYYYY
jgi:hypothetical protein